MWLTEFHFNYTSLKEFHTKYDANTRRKTQNPVDTAGNCYTLFLAAKLISTETMLMYMDIWLLIRFLSRHKPEFHSKSAVLIDKIVK